jgi:hypothetical protein
MMVGVGCRLSYLADLMVNNSLMPTEPGSGFPEATLGIHFPPTAEMATSEVTLDYLDFGVRL